MDLRTPLLGSRSRRAAGANRDVKGGIDMALNVRPRIRALPWNKPKPGMTLAFKRTASEALADIPAKVIEVWPRFRSGDYLVTLEFAQPIKYRNEIIRHIDAFVSELYEPGPQNTVSLPVPVQASQRAVREAPGLWRIFLDAADADPSDGEPRRAA